MIIKMDYQDIGLVGIKTNYNNKIKNHYIRFIVDEYSIDNAIQNIKNNKWVVALDYEGDLQYLFSIDTVPNVPIIVTKEMKEINELSVGFFMKCVPDWVIVSIKTPSDFTDMKIIEALSKEYKNVRFCGGKLLRLPGCNIGCIQRDEVPKVPDSKISFYTEGCSCIMITMPIEEVEGVDLLYKDKEEAKEIEKEIRKKKIISSIDDLLGM